MDIQQLRYVVALAQERHFLRAARVVNVTQPTLSQQIRKLEGELGRPLFERSPRGVRLTADGERFLPHAQAILAQLTHAVNQVRQREARGVLRVGAIPTICPYVMPEVLRAFKRVAPLVHLELSEETTATLLDLLRSGRLDVALLALPVEDHGLASLSVGTEEFLLGVARQSALARQSTIELGRLAQERLLLLQEGHCLRKQSLAYCRAAAKSLRVVFQGGSLGSVMRMAEAGEGVTFVPKMAAEARRHPGLRFLPFHAPKPTRELGLTWRLTAPLTHAQELFMATVESAVRPHCMPAPTRPAKRPVARSGTGHV